MNSLLPNMRLLGLESSQGGRDYSKLCSAIDDARETLGYDLAEESVYFFYSQFPDQCRVARSVTGPVKDVGSLLLWDWVSAPVQRIPLEARTWETITSELEKTLSDSQNAGKNVILKLIRRVHNGQLSLSLEGIVHL